MPLEVEVDGRARRPRPSAIAETIREVTKLRGEVALLRAGQPANDGKVIEDARRYE